MTNINDKIEQIINSDRIVLFMKGDKHFPKCGFSMKVVSILNALAVDYTTFDILEDEEIRQAIKDYSDWPTFPQLYVDRELIGGCDIVEEMYETKELQELLIK